MADIGRLDAPRSREQAVGDAEPAYRKRAFYRELIVAARFFAERARGCEERAVGAGNGQVDATVAPGVRHRSYVTGAVLSAAAFLEASINELYLELHSPRSPEPAAKLPRGVFAVLGRFWSHVEHAPVLHRYQVVLTVADAERFDERRAPFQDADSLMKLRDALVHNQPERPESRRRFRALEQRLRQRFDVNALAPADSPWFPDICLSSACAEWAVQSADAFSTEFCGRMSLPARGLDRSEVDTRVVPAARSRFTSPNAASVEPNGPSPGHSR